VVPRSIRVGGVEVVAGYLEGVAVVPDRHGSGIGATIVRATNAPVRERYDVGFLSTSCQAFYERLGWTRWRGRTYADEGLVLRRTPGEDAGIMVLPGAAGIAIDLDADLTCRARAGGRLVAGSSGTTLGGGFRSAALGSMTLV
jgi:hypothetical protein